MVGSGICPWIGLEGISFRLRPRLCVLHQPGGRQDHEGARHVERGADPETAFQPVGRQQHPGGDERSRGGPEGVDPVERPDRRCRALDPIGQRPPEQRQRGAHEEGGPQETGKQNRGDRLASEIQRAKARVQNVVVQRGAVETEHAHRDLGGADEEETRTTRHAVGHVPPGEGADAEPAHEGGHDDRGREDIRAREEGQQALPDHLIQQRGEARGAEDDEGERKHERVRVHEACGST